MRNGKLINVDDMDNNHIRNAFKILLRNLQKLQQNNSKLITKKFTLNGDMAQSFNQNMEDLKHEECYDPYNDEIIDGMTDWRETQ